MKEHCGVCKYWKFLGGYYEDSQPRMVCIKLYRLRSLESEDYYRMPFSGSCIDFQQSKDYE